MNAPLLSFAILLAGLVFIASDLYGAPTDRTVAAATPAMVAMR
jgi:hypothetical protein